VNGSLVGEIADIKLSIRKIADACSHQHQ
jgi:hypothetical protein